MKSLDQNCKEQRNSTAKTSNLFFLEISRDHEDLYSAPECLSQDRELGMEQWLQDGEFFSDPFQFTPISYFSFLFIFNLNVCLTEVLKMS